MQAGAPSTGLYIAVIAGCVACAFFFGVFQPAALELARASMHVSAKGVDSLPDDYQPVPPPEDIPDRASFAAPAGAGSVWAAERFVGAEERPDGGEALAVAVSLRVTREGLALSGAARHCPELATHLVTT